MDATYLGVHGFDPEAGLTTPNIAEAQTNRTLIGIGAQLMVLADHTKYREVGTNVFARMRRVDNLIVDDGLADRRPRHHRGACRTPDHRHGDASSHDRPATRWTLADGRELLLFALPGHTPAPVPDRRPLPRAQELASRSCGLTARPDNG